MSHKVLKQNFKKKKKLVLAIQIVQIMLNILLWEGYKKTISMWKNHERWAG